MKAESRFMRTKPGQGGGPAVILFPDEVVTRKDRWKRVVGVAAVSVVAAAIVWVSWPGEPDYRLPPPATNSYAVAPGDLRSQSYGGATASRTRTPARPAARPARATREREPERPRPAAAPAVAARDSTPAATAATADTAAAVIAPPGRLMISSMPWGRLFVDGQFSGNTPRVNVPVAAGRRRILITREGYAPFDTVITVISGTPVRITDITLRSTRQCDSPPCS